MLLGSRCLRVGIGIIKRLNIMSYISSTNKSFLPVSEVNIGDKVCYKNRNGNWYEGTVLSKEGNHQCLLAPRTKKGIIVDYGDISLIQQINELFTASASAGNGA